MSVHGLGGPRPADLPDDSGDMATGTAATAAAGRVRLAGPAVPREVAQDVMAFDQAHHAPARTSARVRSRRTAPRCRTGARWWTPQRGSASHSRGMRRINATGLACAPLRPVQVQVRQPLTMAYPIAEPAAHSLLPPVTRKCRTLARRPGRSNVSRPWGARCRLTEEITPSRSPRQATIGDAKITTVPHGRLR